MSTKYNSITSDRTVSVQDFIALRNSDEITYYNYSILEHLDGYDMFITSVLYDYDDEIQNLAVTLQLSDTEKAKYRFKPYLLAFDIYGATEAKFIIMMLNNIIDPKDFDFNRVKVLKPGDLKTILGRINSVNEDYISKNRSRLRAEFKLSDGNPIWNE